MYRFCHDQNKHVGISISHMLGLPKSSLPSSYNPMQKQAKATPEIAERFDETISR